MLEHPFVILTTVVLLWLVRIICFLQHKKPNNCTSISSKVWVFCQPILHNSPKVFTFSVFWVFFWPTQYKVEQLAPNIFSQSLKFKKHCIKTFQNQRNTPNYRQSIEKWLRIGTRESVTSSGLWISTYHVTGQSLIFLSHTLQ